MFEDSYLAPHAAGKVRVFSVANAAGKTVATIGIVCEEHRWRSIGIRAACNRLVTGTLVGLKIDRSTLHGHAAPRAAYSSPTARRSRNVV